MDRLLFRRIDNSPLLIFRILFGFLISVECFGAIITGWLRRTLIEPEFTFSFIGFEWLQPLPDPWMYLYFVLMGVLGIGIALGYRYRFCMIAFTVLWTGVYLMQKSAYNNHYYLLILISGMMSFFPANRGMSLDAWRRPEIKEESMYAYVRWIIILQLFIVYTYAAIAKLYADWLDMSFIRLLMEGKAGYKYIGSILQEEWVAYGIRAFGILFDMFIIPALLWKPTRKYAFFLSIFFHLFNSIVFRIGIFPYLSLAFTIFFFEPTAVRKFFRIRKPALLTEEFRIPSYKKILYTVLGLYFVLQLGLPLRHHLIPDNVLWTEEGHRMSWRMMLRSRRGQVKFTVVRHDTGERIRIDPARELTSKQLRKVKAYPDFIWQYAQRLEEFYAARGVGVSVYVDARVSINGRPPRPLVDPSVDLAAEEWDHFRHHSWLLPSRLDRPED